MTLGQELSPILIEIEETLWEAEAREVVMPPQYTKEGFRAAIKIFASALMDKMWDVHEDFDLSLEDRLVYVEKAGQEIRELVKKHTGIDPHDFYK